MLSYTISELRVACSFQTRNCRHNCNDSKCLKLNFFLERTEPSMNFGEFFASFRKRSAVTFVDFCLWCELELKDWYSAKSKLHWNRPKWCSASMSCLWALIQDLSKRQPKSQFSWRETRKVTFCHFEKTTNFNLIQVDTSWYKLTAHNWHWVVTGLFCANAHVIIVSGNLAHINLKSSEVYLSCNRKTHMSMSVPVY